jgi:VWFA-related protein
MFRRLACCAALVSAGFVAAARGEGPIRYKIERPEDVAITTRPHNGSNALFVTLRFCIRDNSDGGVATDIAKDEIRVEEDGLPVSALEVTAPAGELLKTVLALDISGSMAAESKWPRVQEAARTFLANLHPRSDSGLILFDHEIRVCESPELGPGEHLAHRDAVRRLVAAARPGGGTAYLDAAAVGVEMLKDVAGRKAIVLMTDGVDMNSRHSLDEVVRLAGSAGVPVYTIGIGEPGKNEPVTTVLVLDKSGSMRQKANVHDTMTKIAALQTAAGRFVELMRPNARTTLLPFSTEVDSPEPFTDDKDKLKEQIARLSPEGGTSLYDAVYVGVQSLVAARAEGRRAVVVLTDGQDEEPGSHHSEDDVIEAAKEANVALHLLGLGRPREINEPVMKRMADATGGKYYHAGDPQQLINIFEHLCIDLHDDGIDEDSLRKLAAKTGGRYVPARDLTKLSELFGSLADELQSTYTVTFPSRRPTHDGTARGIDIRIVRGGVQVSDVASTGYLVHGVVVPEMDAGVYLGLLGLLVGLLAVPAGIRRLTRPPAA